MTGTGDPFKGEVLTGTFIPRSAHLSDSLLLTGTTKLDEVWEGAGSPRAVPPASGTRL